MDASTTQIILSLAQQNSKLVEEVAQLKAELAKYQLVSVDLPTKAKASRKSKKAESEESSEPIKPKNPARVETGKRLAAWNATVKLMREEFIDNAKLNW